jgi:L-cysteine S-thiosulfotransferase
MRRADRTTSVLVLFLALSGLVAHAVDKPPSPQSGRTFQSPETQQLEADDGANPGMLWVEQGAALWTKVEGQTEKSCDSCHRDANASLKSVAATYPKIDKRTGRLFNLEGRINNCRTERMSAPAFAYESPELLGLTAYITHQSRGLPRKVAIDGPAKPFFEAGKTFYETRQGQLNVACTQCHDENVGKRLRGDKISQGQTNGWPAYRLEWQTFGSLHRRLRACSLGVRAEILDYGAPEYQALELYLAWRGEGLPMESAGVRR